MNCNCSSDENVIKFIKGTSVSLKFNFVEDISTYTGAEFVISKDYGLPAIITKTITEFENNSINIELTPDDTNLFNIGNPNNSASYLWALDLLDSVTGLRVNVFPKTGQAAPLCIVYKHV